MEYGLSARAPSWGRGDATAEKDVALGEAVFGNGFRRIGDKIGIEDA